MPTPSTKQVAGLAASIHKHAGLDAHEARRLAIWCALYAGSWLADGSLVSRGVLHQLAICPEQIDAV